MHSGGRGSGAEKSPGRVRNQRSSSVKLPRVSWWSARRRNEGERGLYARERVRGSLGEGVRSTQVAGWMRGAGVSGVAPAVDGGPERRWREHAGCLAHLQRAMSGKPRGVRWASMKRRITRVRRCRFSKLGGKAIERVGGSRMRWPDRSPCRMVSTTEDPVSLVGLTGAAVTSPKKKARMAKVLVCILVNDKESQMERKLRAMWRKKNWEDCFVETQCY